MGQQWGEVGVVRVGGICCGGGVAGRLRWGGRLRLVALVVLLVFMCVAILAGSAHAVEPSCAALGEPGEPKRKEEEQLTFGTAFHAASGVPGV